jgi:hypothetical protein
MKTRNQGIKVSLLAVVALLCLAGAAWACPQGQGCNTPGCDQDQVKAPPAPAPPAVQPQAQPGLHWMLA